MSAAYFNNVMTFFRSATYCN